MGSIRTTRIRVFDVEGQTQADALANLDVLLRKRGTTVDLVRCEVKSAVPYNGMVGSDMWTITLVLPEEEQ